MSMITEVGEDDGESEQVAFTPAHFPNELGLPPGADTFFNDARTKTIMSK